MAQLSKEFTTDLWARSATSRGTTVPQEVLAYTQAPVGPTAEVRWKLDDDLDFYVEFARADATCEQFAYKTSLDRRGENSHATTVPKPVLDHLDAPRDDAHVTWTFDTDDPHGHPLRIQIHD